VINVKSSGESRYDNLTKEFEMPIIKQFILRSLLLISLSPFAMASSVVVNQVNTQVNSEIIWKADNPLSGSGDFWQLPSETISLGSGDCEDIAYLKMVKLQQAHIPAFMLSGMLPDGAHMITVAIQEGQFLVLDNRLEDVIPLDQFISMTDFKPMLGFNQRGVYKAFESVEHAPYLMPFDDYLAMKRQQSL